MKVLTSASLAILSSSLIYLAIDTDNPCTDQRTVDNIKIFEGWDDNTYLDIVGIETVGHGYTESFLNMFGLSFSDINKESSDNILKSYCYIINDRVFSDTYLTKTQRAAAFSLLFNIGETAYKRSTLHNLSLDRKLTNEQVCNELKKYIYAGGKVSPGLVNRRSKECGLL